MDLVHGWCQLVPSAAGGWGGIGSLDLMDVIFFPWKSDMEMDGKIAGSLPKFGEELRIGSFFLAACRCWRLTNLLFLRLDIGWRQPHKVCSIHVYARRPGKSMLVNFDHSRQRYGFMINNQSQFAVIKTFDTPQYFGRNSSLNIIKQGLSLSENLRLRLIPQSWQPKVPPPRPPPQEIKP